MREISFCDKDEKKITLSKNGGPVFHMSIDDKGASLEVNLTRPQMEILLNACDDLLESEIVNE